MDQGVYRLFSEVQHKHWWFVGRRIIIEDVLRRKLTSSPPSRIAEFGCGTGAMLPMLSQFGEPWGIDNSPEAVDLCRKQGLRNVYLDQDPAWQRVMFEGMAFFDVIEHVPDDVAFLKNCLGHLQSGGWVIITVPALMSLWSEHDELNKHYRRYSSDQLAEAIAAAGLQLERISYFNSLLYPVIACARAVTRAKRSLQQAISSNGKSNLHTDFERNISFLNGALQALFASERFVLRHGSFPIGVSLLALARKPSRPAA